MKNDETMVTETTGEVAPEAEATPTNGVESTQEATPANSSDAELETIRAKYEEQFAKVNQDLNAMKSTFQKKEAQRLKEWEAREATYKQQLEELRLATMDEDQRKAYESTASQRRAAELEQQLQTVTARQAESEAMLRAQNFFMSQGVPVESLNLDEGYDELWASGLEFMTAELAEYRKLKTQTNPKSPKKPEVNAPPVVSSNNAPASAGTTWEALIKRLNVNSEDDVYRLIETGQLSPDVLPGMGKS